MPTIKQPILASYRDWDNWYRMTKVIAQVHDIWDVVNPELDEPELLIAPPKPIVKDARVVPPPSTEGSTPGDPMYEEDLTEVERFRLKQMRRDYVFDMQIFRERKKGLCEFRLYLINTVASRIAFAIDKPTPHETMKDLMGMFCPNPRQRRAELQAQYAALKKYPPGQLS